MNLKYIINGSISGKDILNLRAAVGWSVGNLYSLQMLDIMLEKSFFHIVCYDVSNNMVVGFINVVSNGITDAYIQDFMVIPSYQTRGIGSKMLSMALDYLHKKSIPNISLIFDESLTAFYQKFGFKIQMSGRLTLK